MPCKATKLKRRLRKEISDKEVEINNLQNRVDELTTSKLHFSEKLTLVESQYNASIECSAKLGNKLEELTETCDKKQEHIKGLEINIKEYQKYFNELNSKGSSLETSSDNLEDSFALAVASMPKSMSSPENLGKMVDMQLREQMALYDSLRDKFNGIETENQQLKEQIEEHIRRTAALELKCRQVIDENTAKAQQNEEKCQQFAVLTKESELNVAKIQSLRTEFDSLTLKVNDNHRTIENLNDTKASLQQQLNVREDEVTELNTQLETANVELIAAETKRLELASQHREILSQKDVKLTEAETEKTSLCDQVNDLKSSVSSAQEINAKLRTKNGDLVLAMEKAEWMRSEMSSQHQEILSQKDAKLTEAETEKCILCDQVNDLKSSVSRAKELNVKLRTENGELVLAMEKAETMRSKMSSQHQEILSQKDAKLTEAETEKTSLCDQVNDLKSSVSSAQEINAKLRTKNGDLVLAMEKAEWMRSEMSSQHQEILSQKDAKLTEAETEKTSLCDQVNDLKSSVSRAKELNAKLRTENGELVLAMEKAETMRSKMSSQHQEILSQKDVKLTEAETEKTSLCDQVNDLKSSVSSAQEINAKLRTKNGDLVLAMEKAEWMRSEMSSQHQEILSQKDAKLTEAETEKCILCDQVNDLKSSVSRAKELNVKLRTENGELVLAMEKAETMRSKMSSQHQEILSQKDVKLTEAETEKTSLCDQVNDLKSSVSSAQEINAKLRTKNGDLVLAMEKAEWMRSEMSSQHQEILSQKDAKLTEAETEKCILCDQVNDLKSSVSRAKELNVKLRTENGELVLAMEKAETMRSKMSSQHQEILSQKDVKLTEAETEKTSLCDQVNDLKSSVSSAQEINAKLRTKNGDLVLAMEKAEWMRSEMSSQHQEILSQKDAKLTEAETEKTSLCDQVNDLKSSVSRAKELNLELRTKNGDLVLAMEKAEWMRSEMSSQLEEIRNQKDAMLVESEADVSSLRNQVEKLKSCLSSAEETHVALQTRNEELVMAMENENEELRETVDKLTTCRKDRDSLQQSSDDLTERVAKLTAERQQIDTSNEMVLCERDSLRDKLDIVEKSRLELESRLKVLECSRANLETQLNQSEDEKEKLTLNLQRKIDEAEASELALEEWSQRYMNEVAEYERAVQRNNLVCESYELQITSLTNANTELTASVQILTQSNDDLRAELSQIEMRPSSAPLLNEGIDGEEEESGDGETEIEEEREAEEEREEEVEREEEEDEEDDEFKEEVDFF